MAKYRRLLRSQNATGLVHLRCVSARLHHRPSAWLNCTLANASVALPSAQSAAIRERLAAEDKATCFWSFQAHSFPLLLQLPDPDAAVSPKLAGHETTS